jgi:hypothetical protein
MILGLLLVSMLAGEFADMWQRRLHRLTELNYHQHLLLQKFTRSYQLLSLSHERLERRVLANVRSPREAITYLRQCAMQVGTDSADGSELFDLMMKVLSSFGLLQVAALYRVDEHGEVGPQPVARLGNPPELQADAPLLVEALRARQLTCIRPEDTATAKEGGGDSGSEKTLIAAMPLIDVHGHLWAVVVVHAMPFEALNREHLNLLAVLGGHLGDLLALASGGGAYQFHAALLRSQSDAREHHLPAMLHALVLTPGQAPPDLWSELLEQSRGIDQQWVTRTRRGHNVLLLVMPLTDAEGERAFRQRLDTWSQARYGKPLGGLGVRSHCLPLDGVGPAQDRLRELKELCEKDDR